MGRSRVNSSCPKTWREKVDHESDVAEETMSTTVKLAKEIDEPDINQPTEEDTDERVMTSHTEKCEKCEKCEKSENYAKKSQEAKVKLSLCIQILTLICTMSASLQFERNVVLLKEFKIGLEKKGLDRKTNRQGLMKAETQPRSARLPP